jgi:hypothetical protein
MVYNPGTYNFDATALATNEVYAIRAEIQDADSGNWLLSDEEIQQAIDTERNFWGAAARCAEMIARGFLRKQDVKLGRSLSIAYAKAAEQYFAMAQTLRRKALGTVIPFVGGMSKSVKLVYDQDTDLVKPLWTKTMQQNPWTGGYSSDSLGPFLGDNDDAGVEFT